MSGLSSSTTELLVGVSGLLLLSNVPYGGVVLAPLRLLTTWAHEVSHALAACATGGRVDDLQVFRDGSGLARTRVPNNRWAKAVVAGAGYPGASLFGAALLSMRHVDQGGVAALFVLGLFIGLSVLLWVRNLFGVLALLGVGVLFVAAGMFLDPVSADLVVSFVGVATCMHALTSLRALFGSQQVAGGQVVVSDAHRMAELLWLPSWVWAVLWICVGVAATLLAV